MMRTKPLQWAVALSLPLSACTLDVGGISETDPSTGETGADDGGLLDDASESPIEDAAALEETGPSSTDDAASSGDAMQSAPADASAGEAPGEGAPGEGEPPVDMPEPPVDMPEQPGCTQPLALVVRDFTEGHPDFPKLALSSAGLVDVRLDADRKPSRSSRAPLTGPRAFEQWFRDVPTVNLRVTATLELTQLEPGRFVYASDAFFPIDGQGFVNAPAHFGYFPRGGRELGGDAPAHNYLFTTEGHFRFAYQGGETLSFTSDDDVWIFINDQLALDLGATVRNDGATVSLDEIAETLRIEKGKIYPLDIFHAARSTDPSAYRLETTIDLSCRAAR